MRPVLARRTSAAVMTASLLTVLLASSAVFAAETIIFEENAGYDEVALTASTPSLAVLDYHMEALTLDEVEFGGEFFTSVSLSGVIIPGDEGAPNLPGFGRMLAIPAGSTPRLSVSIGSTHVIRDIDVLPAPDIPLESSDGLLAKLFGFEQLDRCRSPQHRMASTINNSHASFADFFLQLVLAELGNIFYTCVQTAQTPIESAGRDCCRRAEQE